MATKTISTRCSNGVSYGHRYVITAEDTSAGNNTFLFDFDSPYALAAMVAVHTSAGVPVAVTGLTYPAAGQVQVTIAADDVDAGNIISVVAQNALHE